VGVIGTGSSGIQSIPLIAAEADHVYVFQRTPNYSIPARNGPIDPEYVQDVKSDYPGFRAENAQFGFGLRTHSRDISALEVTPEEREREFDSRWAHGGLPFISAFNDIGIDETANSYAREYLHRKISELVDDPETAKLLSPDTTVGCKRLCVDSDYFATFNRDNVTLVDVRSAPIECITQAGLRTSEAEYAFDRLVLATGFDAMTGALLKVDIRGVGGLSLREKWAEGPRTLLGLGTAGFPNFFTITGPGSPSVLSNMVPSIEQHVNWIADCIEYLGAQGLQRIEAELAAEDAWVAHVNEVASLTLYTTCNSWYLGANVPGKPRVFMPYLGFPPYVEKCNEVAAKGYEGFALS
jgi:cyclohexanone monooxygenase